MKTIVKGSRLKIEVSTPKDKVSKGGIIMATDIKGQEDQEVGEVVQKGHLAYANFEQTGAWCEIGDTVLFQRYAGKPREEIDENGTPRYYRIIKDIDVIAVIEDIDNLEKVNE